MLKKITETTLIPLSLVIMVVGAVSYITTLHDDVQAAIRTLSEVKDSQAEYQKMNQEVRERLIRIEAKLGQTGSVR